MKNQKKSIHALTFVTYPIYPAKMGGQKGIALFYSFFAKLVDVTIISTKDNGSPENLNADFLPVLSTKKSRYYDPRLLLTIQKLIKEKSVTHLILEQPFLGWLGILSKIIFNLRIVVHSHNIESLRFKSMGKWWWKCLWYYEKATHRFADVNFFISNEDKEYAIKHFKLNANNCHTITYGFELKNAPTKEARKSARELLLTQHQIPSNHKILLFNGTLDYKPNLDAVNIILNEINPSLLQKNDLNYTIIICGKNLPKEYNELKEYEHKNIVYAGFVDDINIYFKGADIFLNPVIDGGGIKTKLVEALGHNMKCISTTEGAIGIPEEITNGKLKIIKAKNWNEFTDYIVEASDDTNDIPNSYFEHFYWENIAIKAQNILTSN